MFHLQRGGNDETATGRKGDWAKRQMGAGVASGLGTGWLFGSKT
jgi:hypothetical protein